MSRPDFSAQTAEPMDRAERRAWIDARSGEFKDAGAKELRLTSERISGQTVLLIEGWREKRQDYPDPHFALQAPTTPTQEEG